MQAVLRREPNGPLGVFVGFSIADFVQGIAGLLQELILDLAADMLQVGDAFLQLLDIALVARLGIRQPAFDLRFFFLQYPPFLGLGLFQSLGDLLLPFLETGLVLFQGDAEVLVDTALNADIPFPSVLDALWLAQRAHR